MRVPAWDPGAVAALVLGFVGDPPSPTHKPTPPHPPSKSQFLVQGTYRRLQAVIRGFLLPHKKYGWGRWAYRAQADTFS